MSHTDRMVQDCKAIHHMYFSNNLDELLDVKNREWYVLPLHQSQVYMIEEAQPWGNLKDDHVFTLKAFSEDLMSIITIGTWAKERDARNVMMWVRANNHTINTPNDVSVIIDLVSEVFAKPCMW